MAYYFQQRAVVPYLVPILRTSQFQFLGGGDVPILFTKKDFLEMWVRRGSRRAWVLRFEASVDIYFHKVCKYAHCIL